LLALRGEVRLSIDPVISGADERREESRRTIMGELKERFVADMQMRGLREKTQKSYVQCVKVFARHFMRSPREMGIEQVGEFLRHMLRDKNSSSSTLIVYRAALKFLLSMVSENRRNLNRWSPSQPA
jgi:hypothetical protein